MDTDDIRAKVLDSLTTVAPEIEPDGVDHHAALRQQVDLDSMDWLNFLRGVHQRCGVDIPETDYDKLRTLSDIVDYIAQRAFAEKPQRSSDAR